MSTTINSTQTPELEVVSVAEDASVQVIEQVSEINESSDCHDPADEGAEAIVVTGKSKEALVDMLAELIKENSVESIKEQVESIKTAFYKIHRAQVDARLKEAAEQGVEAEIVPDADEARLKELLKVYREARDKVTAESEKVKEENYRLKCEIIEELKTLVLSEETLNVTYTP